MATSGSSGATRRVFPIACCADGFYMTFESCFCGQEIQGVLQINYYFKLLVCHSECSVGRPLEERLDAFRQSGESFYNQIRVPFGRVPYGQAQNDKLIASSFRLYL